MSNALKSSVKSFYARDKKMPSYFKQYDFKYFKINSEDEILLDMLPYRVTNAEAHSLEQNSDIKEGEFWPWLCFGVHTLSMIPYVCPATFGESCFICEKRKELATKYPKEKLQVLNQKRMLAMYISRYNVLPLQAEIFITAYNTFGKPYINLLEMMKDDRKYTIDEENGCSLALQCRLERKNGFQYYELATIQLRERPFERLKGLWGTLPSLEDFLVRTSNDRLEKIYLDMCRNAKRMGGNASMSSVTTPQQGGGDEEEF